MDNKKHNKTLRPSLYGQLRKQIVILNKSPLGGQLNPGKIAKAVGCGKSALNQNPALKEALVALENSLREKGFLPPLTESAKDSSDKPKQYDSTCRFDAVTV
jgi:hypothetical protein